MVRAFLIGAGATRAQYDKAPLSADFLKLLSEHHPQLFLDIKATIKKYLSEELQNKDIEQVVRLANKLSGSDNLRFSVNLFSAISHLLVSTTGSDRRSMQLCTAGNTNVKTTFHTLLLDKRLKDDDFFITLNYDLYLDREILSIGKGVDYGTDEGVTHSVHEAFRLENKFSVYHLHGSLNWERVQNRISIHLGAVDPRYLREGSNLCLIPPGQKELDPILHGVWEKAERRLSNADELIIIGCSLNLLDVELIELIKKFKQKKGPENVKIVSGSSPNPNYKHIFGEDFNHIYDKGFNTHNHPNALEFIFGNS